MEPVIIGTNIKEVQIKYKTQQRNPETRTISNSRDVFEVFRPLLISERVEIFVSIMLNSKNRIMSYEIVSRGSLSTSVVHPREVFSTPVRLQAAGLIFLHNHPSGDPAPSMEDQQCTIRLVEAGKLLGINVLDHIVFGETDYYSFAENGTLTGN
jgi:DNA repair protein RadC